MGEAPGLEAIWKEDHEVEPAGARVQHEAGAVVDAARGVDPRARELRQHHEEHRYVRVLQRP